MAPPPPRSEKELSLGALAQVVGYHLAQATIAATAAFEHHIGEPLGLRKIEFSLLMLLLANGPTPPKRLSHTLALTAPALTLLINRLEDRGLVRRERNPQDGRSQHIVLTEAGKKLSRHATKATASTETAASARLSRAEHAMLIELLCKLAGRAPP